MTRKIDCEAVPIVYREAKVDNVCSANKTKKKGLIYIKKKIKHLI